MALDPERMKKRRQQRAAQREKQQVQRKKLMQKLMIAGGVLLLALIVIIVIAASSGSSGQKTQDELTVVHVAAAGDLNITDKVVEAGGAEMDYTELFMDVAHLLTDADVSVVNLEGVVCGDPYGDSKSTPLSLLQSLSEAGVDLVQLANSYSIYKGVSGLNTTIDNVRAVGLEPVGVYKTAGEYERSGGFTLCEVKGVKIAFVAFTKGMDGMALPEGSGKCVNVLYTDYESTYQKVNREGINQVLREVREENPDVVIALLHWGSEFNDTISGSQKDILELMQSNGVDVVLGTHSHYVQQIVHDKERNKFVAYSLGDFISGNLRSGSEYSIVLNLEITKNETTGKTTITDYTCTPIYTVAEEGKPMRIMRIRETMAAYEGGYISRVSEATYQGMAYALERIDARIKGE